MKVTTIAATVLVLVVSLVSTPAQAGGTAPQGGVVTISGSTGALAGF